MSAAWKSPLIFPYKGRPIAPLWALPEKRLQRVTLSLPKGLPQVSHGRKILRCAQDDTFGTRFPLYKRGVGGIWRPLQEIPAKGIAPW